MRDIKFRGKDVEDGAWIEGFLFERLPPPVCIVPENYIPEKSEWWILINGMSDWNLPRPMQYAKVDPATIGQFTGLRDKNGKEIYEGDIISYNGSKEAVYFDTSLRIPCFTTGIGSGSSTAPHPYVISKRHEVIGNIHDNPEILKEDT